MTLNQMKYFVTLAETLSYTEAAKCLFITQPALSRQINALEDEIGTALFVRTKRSVKLTPGGVVLYRYVSKMIGEYQEAVDQARSANEGLKGRLRIGFLDVYDIMELFPDILQRFQEQYEDIQLTMERFSLAELPQKLYDDKLDLILTYGFSLYDKPNLVTANIQKFESCLLMHKDHPMAQKEHLTLLDLKDEWFVQLGQSESEDGYRYIESLFAHCNIHPKVRRVHQMEDVLLWIQTKMGVSITTNVTIEKHYQDLVLKPLEMEEAKGHDVTMAWLKNNYNPAIALFMEMVDR